MRITLFISLVSATTLFAQSAPVVSPDALFVGEVLSVVNLAKGTNGQEGYKAMVKIESVTLGGSDFSVSNTVPVYGSRSTGYHTDKQGMEHWTTNTNVDNQLHTNTTYFFSCRSHCNIKSEYGFSEETNGIMFLVAADSADHKRPNTALEPTPTAP